MLISIEITLTSAELNSSVTWFIYYLDLHSVRNNCAKFYHCKKCGTDFREREAFCPLWAAMKVFIFNRVKKRSLVLPLQHENTRECSTQSFNKDQFVNDCTFHDFWYFLRSEFGTVKNKKWPSWKWVFSNPKFSTFVGTAISWYFFLLDWWKGKTLNSYGGFW